MKQHITWLMADSCGAIGGDELAIQGKRETLDLSISPPYRGASFPGPHLRMRMRDEQ